MSVAEYLGKPAAELRLAEGDVAGRVEGAVLEGKLTVEEARAIEARRVGKAGEAYESVEDYDPVLRSHCRLDTTG
jgi:hypothetical protein